MENKEFFLQKILDTSPNIIYICDISEGKNIYVNKEITRVLGYTQEEIHNMGSLLFSNVLHPDDIERVKDHYSIFDFAREDEILEIEYRLKSSGDGWRWLKSREIIFSKNEIGRVKEVLGTAEDITNLKIAEEILHKSESIFRLVFDQSPIGAAVLNTDFQFIRVNKTLCKMLKYEESELLFKKFTDITHTDDVSRDIENVNKILEGKMEVYNTEKRYLTKDGGTVWGNVSVRMVKDKNGNPLYFLPLIQDITNQKNTEHNISQNREKMDFLADLLENSEQPFAIAYPDGRLGLFNKAFCSLTGYSREELSNIQWSVDLTPQKWLDMEYEKLKELNKTGIPVRFEKEYIKKDRTIIPIEIFAHIKRDTSGNPEFYYSFITDITNRKMIEKNTYHHMETIDKLNKLLLGREARMVELKNELEKLRKICPPRQ